MAASAATVFTGEQGGNGTGQGAAAILHTETIMPQLIQQQHWQRQEALRVRKEQEAKDRRYKAFANSFNPDEVALADQDEVMGMMKNYHKMGTDFYLSGVDPSDPYSEEGQAMRNERYKIENAVKTANETQKKLIEIHDTIQKDTKGLYDKEYAAEYEEKAWAMPIAERAAFMNENSPYKTVYNVGKSITNLGIKFPQYLKVDEKGDVITTGGGFDEERFKEDMIVRLESDPATQEDFEVWSNAVGNEGKTADDYVDFLAAQGRVVAKETQKRMVEDKSSFGGGATNKKARIIATPSYNPNYGGEEGKSNVVGFAQSGESMPDITVVKGGQEMTMKELQLMKNTDKGIVVVGKAQVPIKDSRGNVTYELKDVEVPVSANQSDGEAYINYTNISQFLPEELQRYWGVDVKMGNKGSSSKPATKQTGKKSRPY